MNNSHRHLFCLFARHLLYEWEDCNCAGGGLISWGWEESNLVGDVAPTSAYHITPAERNSCLLQLARSFVDTEITVYPTESNFILRRCNRKLCFQCFRNGRHTHIAIFPIFEKSLKCESERRKGKARISP